MQLLDATEQPARLEATKLTLLLEELAPTLTPSDRAQIAMACIRLAFVLDPQAAAWASQRRAWQ
jgi:hypothetical protein